MRRTRRRLSRADREKAAAWAVVPGERCAVCGGQATEAHHVVEAQRLRFLGLHHLVYDARNRMALCAFDHGCQTAGLRNGQPWRIPWGCLTVSHWQFAEEALGESAPDYLDRFYGAA